MQQYNCNKYMYSMTTCCIVEKIGCLHLMHALSAHVHMLKVDSNMCQLYRAVVEAKSIDNEAPED